ncbi:MAG: carboxymuconolactone decarboxylase family protein [Puniceicoccales bacterium]
MNRIQTIEPADAPQTIAALYDATQKKLGLIPNMVKVLGNSPAALQGYLSLSGALGGGKLKVATREKLALLIAERNACDYCLSAHTAIGGLLKIPATDVQAARRGRSSNDKEQAILTLAEALLDTNGAVSDDLFADVAAQGVTVEEALEVVAHVALNVLTNTINRFAQTEIDFPLVEAGAA